MSPTYQVVIYTYHPLKEGHIKSLQPDSSQILPCFEVVGKPVSIFPSVLHFSTAIRRVFPLLSLSPSYIQSLPAVLCLFHMGGGERIRWLTADIYWHITGSSRRRLTLGSARHGVLKDPAGGFLVLCRKLATKWPMLHMSGNQFLKYPVSFVAVMAS